MEAFHWRDTGAPWNPDLLPPKPAGSCPPQAVYKPTVKHGSRARMAQALLPWGSRVRPCLSGHSIIATHGGGGSGHSPGQGRAWIPQPATVAGAALSHGLKPGAQWAEPSESPVAPVRAASLGKSPCGRRSSCFSSSRVLAPWSSSVPLFSLKPGCLTDAPSQPLPAPEPGLSLFPGSSLVVSRSEVTCPAELLEATVNIFCELGWDALEEGD